MAVSIGPACDDGDDGGSGGESDGDGGGSDGATTGEDGTTGGPAVDCTDDTGACCGVCVGGTLQCAVGGVDPAAGLDACVIQCRTEWPNEQDCSASAVLECSEANGACDTLEDETCGQYVSELLECAGAS